MTNGVATEPQLTRPQAEQLVGYAFGALPAPTAAPDIQAAGDKYRAGDSETATKIVAGDLLPYSVQDIKKTLANNLSTERGSDGRKVPPTNSDETRRYNESDASAQDIRQFVENGVVTPSFRDGLRYYLVKNCPAVRDIVSHTASKADALKAVDAIVDTMLDDPAYKDGLRQMFNERLNPTKKLTKEEAVRTAQAQLDELKAQLGRIVDPAKLKDAERRVREAENKLALDPNYIEYARRAKTFESIGKRLDTLESDSQRYEAVGRPLLIRRQALETEKTSLDPGASNYANELRRISEDIRKIESDPSYRGYVSAEQQLQTYEQLKSELPTLAKQILPLQDELSDAQSELNTLKEAQKKEIAPEQKAQIEAKIKQKEAELADARDELEAEMIKFSRDVTHMPQDAAEAYINTAFGKLKTNWQEEAKKTAEKDKSDQEALALIAADKLSNQWREDKNVKGITIKKANRDRALNFLAEAFKPGGVANVEARIAALDNVALDHLGLTPQEITAFKAKWNDAEFRKTQADSLAKQALADYFIAGGRMSQDMVVALVSSDWGKGLLEQGRTRANEILTAAKGNKSLLGIKDKALQDIDEIKKSSTEHIKNNWWKYGLAILVLLLILSKVGIG